MRQGLADEGLQPFGGHPQAQTPAQPPAVARMFVEALGLRREVAHPPQMLDPVDQVEIGREIIMAEKM